MIYETNKYLMVVWYIKHLKSNINTNKVISSTVKKTNHLNKFYSQCTPKLMSIPNQFVINDLSTYLKLMYNYMGYI